jgi:hypothetical protein
MRRRLVIAVTCVALFGCAASQYKFTCSEQACEVETAGPATLDFQREFGQTVTVVETTDGRVTLEAAGARETLAMGETKALGPLQVTVTNVKGENAYFTVKG